MLYNNPFGATFLKRSSEEDSNNLFEDHQLPQTTTSNVTVTFSGSVA